MPANIKIGFFIMNGIHLTFSQNYPSASLIIEQTSMQEGALTKVTSIVYSLFEVLSLADDYFVSKLITFFPSLFTLEEKADHLLYQDNHPILSGYYVELSQNGIPLSMPTLINGEHTTQTEHSPNHRTELTEIFDQINKLFNLFDFDKYSQEDVFSLIDLEKLEKAEAANEIGGHSGDMTWLSFGLPYNVNSIPRDLGLNPFAGIVEKVFIPIIPKEIPIKSEVHISKPDSPPNTPPHTNPDTTDECVNAGGSIISGNVLTNDIPGSHGPIMVYEIWYDHGTKSALLNGNSVTVNTEDGGTLTVNPDGTWTYMSILDPTQVDPSQIVNNMYFDDFSYTVIDTQGNISNNGSGPEGSEIQSLCVDILPVFDCESVSFLQTLTFDQVSIDYPQVQLEIQCDPNSSHTYTVSTTQDVISKNDGLLSLREAIIASNADSGSITDIICLDTGIYTLSINPTKTNTATSGDLNITNTSHSLIIQGEGIGNTIIDANFIDRVFNIDPGVKLILRDLSIENGSVKGKDGGGILNNGNLILYDVGVYNNSVTNNGFGGGIASISNGKGTNGDTFIINSDISGNTTERSGAGIYMIGTSTKGTLPTLTIDTSLIHENSTISGAASLGGDGGGGISIQNATANIYDTTIACNDAFDGGGIYAIEKNKEATVVNISGSTIINNLAEGGKGPGGSGVGGGIYDDGAAFQLTNSTISLNTASKGAAIYIDHDGSMIIDNSTIANNSTLTNGQSGAIDTQSHGTVDLTSTIIAANDKDIIYDNNLSDDRDLSGTGFTSGGHNLIGNITNSSNDFSQTTGDILSVDPLLGSIDDNGGPTLTLALQSGSPAIDAGSNPLPVTTDQRGEPRPDVPNTNPDIGAYETQTLPPIILDLNDTGINLVIPQKPILFDANNDGVQESMKGWFGPENAILVYDYYANHNVSQGDQIGFTFYAPEAKTDLQALNIAFDSNHDGILNDKDAHWDQFGVWQDKNQNGISDSGEYLTLMQVGITGIKLSSSGEIQHIGENTISGIGTFTTSDGNVHQFADATFSYSLLSSSTNASSSNSQSVNTMTNTAETSSAVQLISVPPPVLANHDLESATTNIHEG